MSSREEMLARIRAATADISGLPDIPRRYAPASGGPGQADEALVSLFEERVLLDFGGDEFTQFLIGHLQQLDRLLQLRRHYQGLRLAQIKAW